LTAPALAAEGKEFYKGKTVTIIVCTAPGGGYDFYGRMLAQYMEKHLPGSTFIVRNMPGAGHMIGANYLYASKPDGLTLGTFSLSVIYYQLGGREGVRYDLGKMSWIGKAASDSRALVVAKHTGIKDFDQLRKSSKVWKMATSGVGSANYTDMAMTAKIAKLNVKLLTGYNGNAPELAMRRGEIDGGIASFSSALPFVEQGHGRFVVVVSNKRNTQYPLLTDFIKTPLAERVSALLGHMNDTLRVLAGPPGIEPGRLQTLRTAFKDATGDAAYAAQLKQAKRPHDPAVGETVEAAVKDAITQPPETVALIKEIIENASKVKIPIWKGKVTKLEDRNKVVTIKLASGKDFVAQVSGSRTTVKVNGEKVKRKVLAVDMSCDITSPGSGKEASLIDCK
jgi:tripartite-type tricarboxylate transporter receptor subunit TctC